MPSFKALRLPVEVREELDRKIDEGLTSDELARFLRQRAPAVPLSHGAIVRYARRHREECQREREMRIMARAWFDVFGKAAEGAEGRMLCQMMRLITFQQLRLDFQGELPATQPREMLLMARALEDTARADKLFVETGLKLQQEAQAAQARARKKAKYDGLSDEEKIRRALWDDDKDDDDGGGDGG
ncbi:MAG: phage protein Gp27 family protein [Candidatus Binataceae bacterium]